MSKRRYGLLIAGLSVLLLVQLAAQARMSGDGQEPLPAVGPYVDAQVGASVDVPVARPNGGTSTPLSEVALGTCSYVVIYSPTCPASVNAAKRLRRRALDWGLDSLVPNDWVVVWVSVEDGSASKGILPDDFPFQRYHRSGTARLEPAIHLRAYPAHLVLDRDGRVVTSGVGVSLPEKKRLSSSCRILPFPGS